MVRKGTMAVCVLGPRWYHGKGDEEPYGEAQGTGADIIGMEVLLW